MESKIPLPTDNIYKFYALFGLALFISSIAGFLYLNKTTNDLLFEASAAVAELESKENLSKAEVTKRKDLETKVDLAVKDRKTLNAALSALLGIAGCLMCYGFIKWHTEIQPKQDKLLDLQIAKAEKELKGRQPFRGK